MMLERLPETGVRISFLDGDRQPVASKRPASSRGRCGLLLEMFCALDRCHAPLLDQLLQQSVRSRLGTDVAQGDMAPNETTEIIESGCGVDVLRSRDVVDV
jgi:hypothetical protein